MNTPTVGQATEVMRARADEVIAKLKGWGVLTRRIYLYVDEPPILELFGGVEAARVLERNGVSCAWGQTEVTLGHSFRDMIAELDGLRLSTSAYAHEVNRHLRVTP